MNISQFIELTGNCLEDPRRTSYGNILHSLSDILAIACLAVQSGRDTFCGMADWGRSHESDLITSGLSLLHGIPSADTFRRVLEDLDPNNLSYCIYTALEIPSIEDDYLHIDGKTINNSGNKDHKPYQMVTIYSSKSDNVLAELSVPEKTNEINGAMIIFTLIDISGSIITGDAIYCQLKIVKYIKSNGGDFIFILKSNQKNFYAEVNKNYNEIGCENLDWYTKGWENQHGRKELREYAFLPNTSSINEVKKWDGVNNIGIIRKTTLKNGEKKTETRFAITSLTDVKIFSEAHRAHWSIESLHYSLDVFFKEDACRAKKGYSPINLNIIRKFCLNKIMKIKQLLSEKMRISIKRLIDISSDKFQYAKEIFESTYTGFG